MLEFGIGFFPSGRVGRGTVYLGSLLLLGRVGVGGRRTCTIHIDCAPTVPDRIVWMRSVAARDYEHLRVAKWLWGGKRQIGRAGDGKDWRNVGRVGRWYG